MTQFKLGQFEVDSADAVIVTEGWKDDRNKPRFDLIDPDFLFALSDVLTHGEKKYGARNWERGMRWSRVFGALMRHMWAWWKGERYDPETRMLHVAHAAACVMFLCAYEIRGIGDDDRGRIEIRKHGSDSKG